ncbi:hypothetical protein KDL01_40215 [Actinospica durhamensis]|uniref:Uncharacterized protein n=1 Tax=Actinospica durhamensis TaxID=1508375 RepID=A0A941ITB7_9ACTN|nr:hypothetical protein [Actinospica durhamensis]MBR7839549.1 hypothetical protein [Actinospica durhamensis]
MGFFESMSAPPPVDTVRPKDGPWMRPERVVPGSVAADVVLIHTDEVAVVVSGMRAYANGFELDVHARQRHAPAEGRWISRGPKAAPPKGEEVDPGELGDQMLRFGVLYADARRGSTPRLPGPLQREPPPVGEVLIAEISAGHGNRRDLKSTYWIHPLPPHGPLVFVASWLGWGVAETQVPMDSALIREASQRTVTLWPDGT